MILRITSYTWLILEPVSLIFIIEIPSILFTQIFRSEAAAEVAESMDPMRFRLLAPKILKANRTLGDLLSLLLVCISAATSIYLFYDTIVTPLYGALMCTCNVRGDSCREAKLFDYDFWYEYWSKTTPAIFQDVAKLKESAS
eukprot:gnl/TRDRNA2_/TRDRNA2_140407_c0_seq3.p1 gnl/TRDRNA2_/TRDRNA2_140407_c0~~gnl/TRDRNA2_/TRDRNA2_140407_c0_seq3.p1  ORF type:complete len:142 (-),score=21.79 gnl/TRDRNA2_/TRDRNA2_140407_c0_seq3:82-507(-)